MATMQKLFFINEVLNGDCSVNLLYKNKYFAEDAARKITGVFAESDTEVFAGNDVGEDVRVISEEGAGEHVRTFAGEEIRAFAGEHLSD